MDVQNIYNVKYLPSDFKKNKGYERSIEMCNDYNILDNVIVVVYLQR